ncbi:hypothetical protein [Lacrimispora sp.]|uniref:hypothetical protein n=1 Tax=Lacrimispora sp. TaxID=2719234 RepID=UPI0028A5CC1D|nr:hypothetical protein [Lacrimispora sp.]
MIEILDCTLREAPIDSMMFGKKLISQFLFGLEAVGVNIIECGFLKDEEHIEGSTIFSKVEEIAPYLCNKKADTMYVALVDYGRYNLEKLSDYTGESIDGIRVCFKKGQQNEVIAYAKKIMDKGYKVFIQHVDTLAYTDMEILQFIEKVNKLEPYAYSAVDTFGSMYMDDVRRVCNLINNNLKETIKLGFHGHNNLMSANANAQEFIDILEKKRDIMVDSSILGCGRGAGNANTELVITYLNNRYKKTYDLNELLDMIDSLMPRVRDKCNWGYSMPYVLSGLHGAHSFNVSYLLRKHNIKLKDLRSIIEKLDKEQKKFYDYNLLEKMYVDYFDKSIDDSDARNYIESFSNRKILVLAPGRSLVLEREKIENFIKANDPIVISLNTDMGNYKQDIIFFSSCNRYEYFTRSQKQGISDDMNYLITSNIKTKAENNEFIINYKSLIKYGWVNFDSSAVLLLRFLTEIGECKNIYFGGLDGFTEAKKENYFDENMVTDVTSQNLLVLTAEIREMLVDLKPDVLKKGVNVNFITTSIYEDIFEI